MLTKRIIPCLDVKNGQVVKGVQFHNHKIIGDIVELAKYYNSSSADELVIYDITASSNHRVITKDWVKRVAKVINIPFCVAGGIRTLHDAEAILNAGADKISINSPAIENANLINQFVSQFGQQCVVVGVDSYYENEQYVVYQYTGDKNKIRKTKMLTAKWLLEVQERGAGEVVLNCMNSDGMKNGYDIAQLAIMRKILNIPLIASGGAGGFQDFITVFNQTHVDGALAASVFHSGKIQIPSLKKYLFNNNVEVRL